MVLSVLLLLLLLFLFLQTETGQNWVIGQVTTRLSTDLKTRIHIDHVRLHFFDKLDLKGVLVEDQRRDTLLYAGTLQVNITDWFFFKDKAELHYVGLADAQVNLARTTDSLWNYHFLEAYFASTDSGHREPPRKNAGIAFDLKKLVLQNVRFVQKDGWAGTDLVASVKGLDLDAEEISLTRGIFRIDKLSLVDPYFSSYSYKGRRPYEDTTTGAPLNLFLNSVSITNGRLKLDNESKRSPAGVFDSEHLDFSALNGHMQSVGISGDTIRGFVDLSTREQSGLVVKRLKANTAIGPDALVFENLFLQTNRSTLTDHFALRFKKNMDDFEHRVKLEAHFNKAVIASEDLAFFIPDTKTWDRVFRINGKVTGTVDNLRGNDLEIWAGDKTYLNGNLSLVGLPDIKTTFINFESKDLRTTYRDVVSLLPALRRTTTPDFRKLSYLRFKGVFTGFLNDFVTYGTIQTALGTITTDLNMKLPEKGEPVYSGKLSTPGFQLGAFINNDQLGIVEFHGSLKGRSFNWNKLDLDINGTVHRFGFGDYVFKNITANGNLSRRKFNGVFVMNDPNADLKLNGLIDLSGAQPRFDATATVNRADLRALKLTEEPLVISGDFDLNLEGSSISTLLGSARVRRANLFHGGQRMAFDSLTVFSGYEDGLKTLRASSNEFNLTVRGNFDLAALPSSFRFFLNRYYPAYINVPPVVKPQLFTFDITTGMVDDYIHLVHPSLTGFNNSHLTGSLNTIANTMTIDADVPAFGFGKYNFSDVVVKGSGNLDKLVLTGSVNNAVVSETIRFPETTFSIEAQNDQSDITINTTSNQTINKASLSAQVKTFSDGVSILFNPSSFVLNGKNWSIEQGGELNFRKNTELQGQVILREANQEIQLATHPSSIGNWNDLFITLRNLNLGDIAPFVTPNNRLEGLLSGDIIVEDPQNKLNVVASLRTDELRFDNDSLGQVQFGATYNNKSGLLTGRGNNMDPEHKINFDLAMNFKDSSNVFRDRISLHPENFQLKYLERFLGSIVSNIQGYLTGDIDILGEGADRDYLAKVRLKDAQFKVNFTQVTYRLEDTELELEKNRINLNGLRLRDRNGYGATVKGYISHKGFQNMYYDLKVETDATANGRMELLNTNPLDNQLFYGRAYGAGQFVLAGPQNNLTMDVDVTASELDSSFITLPPSNSRQSGQASFMVEKKYGREMNPSALSGNNANLKYNVTLRANPMVNMEVILDEQTGDIIRGKGTGILTINAGTNTPLSINGRYNIDEGNYLFTFQTLFKKPFELRKGANNYIEWTGDPYRANINLEAIYTAEKVSFTPLAGAIKSNLTGFRDDVNVVARLTGELFQPKFDFSLEFPSNSLVYRDPAVSFGIQQIQKNPNELNKQVTYLIVFNSFAPYEDQAASGNPFGEAISSTISGLLFGEINRKLNEVLSSVLQQNKLTVNFSGSLYNRNFIDPNQKGLLRINQGDVNVTVGKSLFEDRLIIRLGGTFDVPIQSDVQRSIQLFPDVTIEILLNQSGSVRATIFYRENADFLAGGTGGSGSLQTKRYGTSISYGREFDSFGELLFRKKKKTRGKLIPVEKDSTQAGGEGR